MKGIVYFISFGRSVFTYYPEEEGFPFFVFLSVGVVNKTMSDPSPSFEAYCIAC
jgi:hypothetical protein